MGLALGTGLALMILTRFRSEEAAVTGLRREAAVAASAAVGSTGRAVLIAGTGLFASLVPRLGHRTDREPAVDRDGRDRQRAARHGRRGGGDARGADAAGQPRPFAGSFGAPRLLARPWKRLAAGRPVLRRAVIAGAAATLALVALAIPALGHRRPVRPTRSSCPKDSKARQDFEAIQRAMGPGWPTPYNIVVVSDHGPITERKMLRQLERFQVQLAKDPRVDSVAGPGRCSAPRPPTSGRSKKKLDESNKLLKGAGGDLGKLRAGSARPAPEPSSSRRA